MLPVSVTEIKLIFCLLTYVVHGSGLADCKESRFPISDICRTDSEVVHFFMMMMMCCCFCCWNNKQVLPPPVPLHRASLWALPTLPTSRIDPYSVISSLIILWIMIPAVCFCTDIRVVSVDWRQSAELGQPWPLGDSDHHLLHRGVRHSDHE